MARADWYQWVSQWIEANATASQYQQDLLCGCFSDAKFTQAGLVVLSMADFFSVFHTA